MTRHTVRKSPSEESRDEHAPEIPKIGKLQQELARIVKLPDVRERLVGLGVEPVGNPPEEFAAYIRAEIAKWARVVKAAGIEPQTW